MNKSGLVVLIWLLVNLGGCNLNKVHKFNSKQWSKAEDAETFPFRKELLNDIIENKLFLGFNYLQLIDSLGEPESGKIRGNNKLYYLIENDYGWDIDPVYYKYLVVYLSEDSIVEKTEVFEWNK